MMRRIRGTLFYRLQLCESWIFFFILGITLVNPPFLQIFNKPLTVMGFPLLFFYFFAGWGVSIGFTYLFSLASGATDEKHSESQKP